MRVPHGGYVWIGGGQIVVAGEHLAPSAVRAAEIGLAPARAVDDEAGPLVALPALPPDAPVGVGDLRLPGGRVPRGGGRGDGPGRRHGLRGREYDEVG